MARFMVAAMPFTGHVAPMCTVAAALVGRGHDVRFYTGRAFERRVTESGATLVPWRVAPDFDENDLPATFPRLVGKKGLSQLLVNVEDLFIGTAPLQVADLRDEWERHPWDAIAADEMSIGAALFAEQSGCPRATVAVLPLNMTVTEGPPPGLGLPPGRNVFTKARDAALRALVPLFERRLKPPLARARLKAGLPAGSFTFGDMAYSRELVVASGSPVLDFGRTTRPAHLHFAGRLTEDAPTTSLPDWWDDLDGRTVVHVTQGTQNIDPSDLIRPTIEALADREVRIVVATGVPGRDILPFAVPANVRVAGFLPYADLLPRVDVVVTNGGWGGTLAALSHGIPLVIAGGDLDKPLIAALVAWSGAGVNLKTGTPKPAQVARAVDRTLTDASYRDAAARVAAELRSLGGAARAAELIETLLP